MKNHIYDQLAQRENARQDEQVFAQKYIGGTAGSLVISIEMKALQEALHSMSDAVQSHVARIAPVLFFGPDDDVVAQEAPPQPGSDLARELFQMKQQVYLIANILSTATQKVNL